MNTMVVKIVWGALTLSQIMYGVILFMVPQSESTPGTPLPLWAPAIVCGAVSLFFFTTRLSKEMLQTTFAHQDVKLATSRAFTFYIICWAMNESVALFGFVNVFISTHQLSDMYPYLFGGLALNLLMFPRLDAYVRHDQ